MKLEESYALGWIQIALGEESTPYTRINYTANVFEIYRSGDVEYSEFGAEDTISLESSAYLQPFMVNLNHGGLPVGLFSFKSGPSESLLLWFAIQ